MAFAELQVPLAVLQVKVPPGPEYGAVQVATHESYVEPPEAEQEAEPHSEYEKLGKSSVLQGTKKIRATKFIESKSVVLRQISLKPQNSKS